MKISRTFVFLTVIIPVMTVLSIYIYVEYAKTKEEVFNIIKEHIIDEKLVLCKNYFRHIKKTYNKDIKESIFENEESVNDLEDELRLIQGNEIKYMYLLYKDKDGYAHKIPDSLLSEFETKNGRKVYDGGGIDPDIYLDPEKLSPITESLFLKFILFDYANKFYLEHDEIAPVEATAVRDSNVLPGFGPIGGSVEFGEERGNTIVGADGLFPLPQIFASSSQRQEHAGAQRWIEVAQQQATERTPGRSPITVSFVEQDTVQIDTPGRVGRLAAGQRLQLRQRRLTLIYVP